MPRNTQEGRRSAGGRHCKCGHDVHCGRLFCRCKPHVHHGKNYPRESTIGAAAAKPYSFVGDIGHAIQKHAEKYGYGVVRDLCGHGVGLEFHEEPEVLHYGHRGTGMLLVPGMVFTIEPMINQGTWKVFIDADDPYGWEVITGDELPSAQWEHTFLMTDSGVEILTH